MSRNAFTSLFELDEYRLKWVKCEKYVYNSSRPTYTYFNQM